MVDLRGAISAHLATVCDNVKMTRPEGDIELPLICYAQTGNTSVNSAADRVTWGVAVYAGTFEQLVDLSSQVDSIMCGNLGYTRTKKTSDADALVDTGLYMCRLDYSALYNKAMGGIIRGSK